MAKNKLPTWVSILIAGVIVVCMLAVAVVGGTAFFIYRHANASFIQPDTAQSEFDTTRAQFSGQKPLIEIRHNEDPVLHRELLTVRTSERKLESLRVLAYDNDANKLVRVSIPFWLLRMAPSKHFSFLNDNGIDIDSDRIRLTLDDIERRGPGLLIDQKDRRGHQVLVWTE